MLESKYTFLFKMKEGFRMSKFDAKENIKYIKGNIRENSIRLVICLGLLVFLGTVHNQKQERWEKFVDTQVETIYQIGELSEDNVSKDFREMYNIKRREERNIFSLLIGEVMSISEKPVGSIGISVKNEDGVQNEITPKIKNIEVVDLKTKERIPLSEDADRGIYLIGDEELVFKELKECLKGAVLYHFEKSDYQATLLVVE